MHGHGGILLEHLKNHALSWDLGPGDRILWFSTTAWMMWNALVSSLLVRASIVMIDGNPLHPDIRWQWRLAAETGATLMGASPGFLMACRKEGVEPAKEFDLSRLRQIGAAGSPLPPEGYRWVAEQFGPKVLLNVGSGGTDVCSGIVQGSPLQPVWAGEIAGPCLGVDAKAFDADGKPVVGDLGELVITAPMPSMPVGFWGDADGSRYRDTYFDTWPGVWRHGDWVRFSEVGSAVIAGRSDATLNRGGVRLGTAEFYRVVEELPEVVDSLVVHLEDPAGGNGQLLLYVRLGDGVELDDALRRADLDRAADGSVAPARPRRDHRRARRPAQPDGQETGAAGEEDPARRRAGRGRQPGRAGRPDVAGRLRDPAAAGCAVRVAVVSTGVIGASWAAHFLARGLDVVATDPAPGAEERLRADVAAHWPVLERIGLAEGASLSRLTFTADPAEAVADADFVQENGPEREDVKHALFAVLDAAARPDVVLASSSSGLLPSVIARGALKHPERVLIGHPFNPPHLIPLVEVVPGERTSDDAVETGDGLLRRGGQAPDPGPPGGAGAHREPPAGRAVAGGVLAGRAGHRERRRHRHRHLPGPRPAVGGPRSVPQPAPLRRPRRYRARSSKHLGPPTEKWWRDLRSVTLTPELSRRWWPGVDDELDGVDRGELATRRDAVLHALLAAKSERRPALTVLKGLDIDARTLVSIYLSNNLEEEDRPWQQPRDSTSPP